MPIVGIGICFAIAAVYTTLTMEVPAFFAQTMFNVVIITAFCAVLQSSLVSQIKIKFHVRVKEFSKQLVEVLFIF